MPASEAREHTHNTDSAMFATTRLLAFSVSCWHSCPLTPNLGIHSSVPLSLLKEQVKMLEEEDPRVRCPMEVAVKGLAASSSCHGHQDGKAQTA